MVDSNKYANEEGNSERKKNGIIMQFSTPKGREEDMQRESEGSHPSEKDDVYPPTPLQYNFAEDDEDDDDKAFILYRYRWLLLTSHCLAFVANCMSQVAFIPIATFASSLFEVSNVMISMCSLVFSISFIPFNFIAIKILSSAGLRVCLLIAAALTIAGVWLRLMVQVTDSFSYVIAGQVLIACGQPFFFNTISHLSSAWFGEKERVTAVTIMSNSIPVGSLIANVIPSLVITDDDPSVPHEAQRASFMIYILTCNLIVTVIAVPLLFIAKSSPPTPPSISASQSVEARPILGELRALFSMKSFNLVNMSISFSFAAYVSFLTV
jgi:hypothetical protein